jgi:hypothetical protein
MPRARRRRNRSAAQRTWGRTLALVLGAALVLVLIVGSLVEITAQSSGIRSYTSSGYGALATRVVDASNQTGDHLATLIKQAPTLPNGFISPASSIPVGARTVLQQGLDEAATSSSAEAGQAGRLAPPSPSGSIAKRLTEVLQDRAAAVSALRSIVDRLLGMAPLPLAGAPVATTTTTTATAAPLVAGSSAQMAAAGNALQQADSAYRALLVDIHAQHVPMRLPKSVWVPLPVATAPLGANRLSSTANELSSSITLYPFHQLIISAVGLAPPAVPPSTATGGLGTAGQGCRKPTSATPGTAPSVLPPTATVTALVTVTNCGTVPEPGVVVAETLALSDAPGAALPAASRARGGDARATVTLASGASRALSLGPLAVAGGHTYMLTLTIANSAAAPGGTQQFLLQIAG